MEPEKVDPREEEFGRGALPDRPVAISGWGWIRDHYGRRGLDTVDDEEDY